MVADSVTILTDADRQRLRQRYEEEGYCISPPLIHSATLDRARGAVAAVMAGEYETDVSPIYRNWNPGDAPRSLVKIDLPHLCNGLALHLRTEHAQLVPTPEPPFHRPDLLDSYACPVLFGLPSAAGVV